MKLNAILEVFDIAYSSSGGGLGGVERQIVGDDVAYLFHDRNSNLSYLVKLGRNTYPFYGNLKPLFDIIKQKRYDGIFTNKYVSIVLSVIPYSEDYELQDVIDDGLYGLTGAGNAKYVYGKFLACLFDFVNRYGLPAVLLYSSYDAKTVSTYNKLLNMVAKKKGFKYTYIGDDYYILDKVIRDVYYNVKGIGIDLDLMANKADEEIKDIIRHNRPRGQT